MTRITAPGIRSRKGGAKIRMVNAYDHPSAIIADRAGADIILVGDSVANVVLGHEDTLAVDVDVMVHHTAAVSRARPNALVVGDMPWMSYHVSAEDTVRNAGRFVREGGAEAVKLEGGRKRLEAIEAALSSLQADQESLHLARRRARKRHRLLVGVGLCAVALLVVAVVVASR